MRLTSKSEANGNISIEPSTAIRSNSGSESGEISPLPKRILRKALKRHGRPKRIVIEGSQANGEVLLSCDTADRLEKRSWRDLKSIRIRPSAYLNNRIEQDHRVIKRRVRPMLGFQSVVTARVILDGIKTVHTMRKHQAKYACNRQPSVTEQFEMLTA